MSKAHAPGLNAIDTPATVSSERHRDIPPTATRVDTALQATLDQALLLAGFPPGTEVFVVEPDPGRSGMRIKAYLDQSPKRIISVEENEIVIYNGLRYRIPGSLDEPVACLVPLEIAAVLAGKRQQEAIFRKVSRRWEASATLDLSTAPTQVEGP